MPDINVGSDIQPKNPYLPLYRLGAWMVAVGLLLAGIVWLSHNGEVIWQFDKWMGLNSGDTLLDWMIVLIAWPLEQWGGLLILGAVILFGIVALRIFARNSDREPSGEGHRVGHIS